MTRACPKCNQLNLPEAAFCHNCASPLSPAPAFGAAPNQQWTPPGGPIVGQATVAGAGPGQKAIISLVLAIVALFCCGFLAGIPAAIVGWMELSAINAGQSSPAGKWMAQVGLWGGIGASILHVIIWVLYLFVMVIAR